MRWKPVAASVAVALAGAALIYENAPAHTPPAPVEIVFAPGFAAQPVPFELFRGSRMMLVGEGNAQPARIMLDSGAGITTVDSAYAARVGAVMGQPIDAMGAGGPIKGRLATMTIEAGPLTLKQATVMAIDLAEISRQIGRPIDIILGRDAFEASVVDVDFEGRRLRFLRPDSFAAPNEAVRLPVTELHGVRRVALSIGGEAPVSAEIDLGHGGSIMLGRDYWQSVPAIAALPFARGQAGGMGGMTPRRMVTLPSVTLAGARFDRVPAVLNEMAADPPAEANVGIDLLQRFRTQLDYSHAAIYLTPLRNAQPLAKDRLGMRLELAGDRLLVRYVSPDGPAAKIGWKVGDAVTAVNGVAVTPGFYRSALSTFSRMPAGTRLDLTRADGTHKPITLADYF